MTNARNHRAPRRRTRYPHRRALAVVLAGIALAGTALADPRPFREYPGIEYYDFPLPHDYMNPAEWTLGRLMYPASTYSCRGNMAWGDLSWTTDYPRADRHIAEMVRRLTAVDARSVEQPVDLDDGDDVFNWPWLYAVEVGTWELTHEQAAKLREYLLRGGFLMVDDFHGECEWGIFLESMHRVFPDRLIVDVDPSDSIFHALYDIEDLSQIPGAQFTRSGRTYERRDGITPHWRGIYDDEGRLMVAITHNMDLGDAVEHSDTPQYPEPYSARAMRTFINYIVYAMTH
ncbi:MAG TPA: DUF4159 domain-containing protein [Gammaproteobacteria bacterium]|nr:DUF4159 domain-containing protein [Gammaproteobacteria bacterium]